VGSESLRRGRGLRNGDTAGNRPALVEAHPESAAYAKGDGVQKSEADAVKA